MNKKDRIIEYAAVFNGPIDEKSSHRLEYSSRVMSRIPGFNLLCLGLAHLNGFLEVGNAEYNYPAWYGRPPLEYSVEPIYLKQ